MLLVLVINVNAKQLTNLGIGSFAILRVFSERNESIH